MYQIILEKINMVQFIWYILRKGPGVGVVSYPLLWGQVGVIW